MRLPFTPYGLIQVIVWPLVTLAAILAVSLIGPRWIGWPAVVCLDLVLVAFGVVVVSFFRDPARDCPDDKGLLLAPADGTIADITTLEDPAFGCKVLRLGIFMSILDVHINRSPCRARVLRIEYQPGRFINALRPASSQVNQSNRIWLQRLEEPQDVLIVRQISGAIARRIVCAVRSGQVLDPGQRIGMIKFGSRTELYVPFSPRIDCLVSLGQHVKAGLSPLIRYNHG